MNIDTIDIDDNPKRTPEFTFFDFEAAMVVIMQDLAQFMQFILRQSDLNASCSIF